MLAYAHSKYWDDPLHSPESWQTDQKGLVEIPVFGDSRVRVLAEQEKPGPLWRSKSYSKVIALETASFPPILDLIVSSARAY